MAENFIDKALAKKLQGDDFLQAMADIYKEPDVWKILDKYPLYVQDVIYMIDYDTEMQMEGLENLAFSSDEEKINKIIQALKRCGATAESDILEKARVLADKALEFEEEEFDEELSSLESKLAYYNDYDAFWELVRNYIDKSQQIQS